MRWMRDYVFIPLRKRRSSEFNAHISIILTFLFSGVWHGAGWLFVIFGLLHGIAVSLHRIWKKVGLKLPHYLGVFITVIFFNCSLLFFRSDSLSDVIRIFEGMLGLNGIYVSENFSQLVNLLTNGKVFIGYSENTFNIPVLALAYIAIFGLAALFLKNSNEILAEIKTLQFKHSLFVAGVLLYALLSNTQTEISPFLYFNF